MPVEVEQRGASSEGLRQVVATGLPELLDQLEAAGRGLPRFVRTAMERLVACGDLSHGFAWLACEGCHFHRLVPRSCRGRGGCPRCGGRRMNALAARWVDEVLPEVPVRQWVLTLPWDKRLLLSRRPDLARGVLRVALRILFRWYRDRGRALGLPDGRTGSITVLQRFGSSLNLNPHFHVLVLDGVYTLDNAPRFVPLDPPTTEDVEDLVERIADAALTWLAKQGIDDDDLPDDPDDAHLLVQAASMAGRTALGRRRVRRVQTFRGREVRLPPRCAACEGFTLHGGTAVGRWDREGLERLCRYVARPPLASDRLAVRRDGRVHLTLKTPWHDGTTALVFSRTDFVARLAALVPPPRAHTVLYHGILAPRATLRSRVVPTPPPPPPEATLRLTHLPAPVPARWRTWAELLARVFGQAGWTCPRCAGPLHLRAIVWPPASIDVLRDLVRSASPPRAPPAPALAS